MAEQKPKGRPRKHEAKPDLLTQTIGEDHAELIQEYKQEQKEQRQREAAEQAAATGAAPEDLKPLKNRAKKARDNSPIVSGFKNVTQAENAATMQKCLDLYNLPKIDTSDYELLQDRIIYYFNWCIDAGMRPGVEGLALALGVTRSTLNRWEHGENGTDRRDIIKKAKQFIANYLEILAQSGKINPVTFIFLTKNNHGYQDRTDVNITVDNPLGDTVTPQSIADRLPDVEQNGIIDADFKEL